jgi:hypothetical protein
MLLLKCVLALIIAQLMCASPATEDQSFINHTSHFIEENTLPIIKVANHTKHKALPHNFTKLLHSVSTDSKIPIEITATDDFLSGINKSMALNLTFINHTSHFIEENTLPIIKVANHTKHKAVLDYYGSIEIFSHNFTELLHSVSADSKIPVEITISVKSSVNNNKTKTSVNVFECNLITERESNKNDIRCSVRQNSSSKLLHMSDFWIKVNKVDTSAEKLVNLESQMFTYQPAWIIGLTVIGCIIAIFFVGCIVAICYTRRPYRRSGKIYEIETTNRKNIQNQPMPGVNVAASKSLAVSKPTKEMYY